MPICKSSAATASKKTASDISADHVTEAAQVKRTREQAYFNSYDFDAIEVLPYDEEDDETAAAAVAASSAASKHLHQPQDAADPRQLPRNANSNNYKFAYLQRLGAFLGRAGGSRGNRTQVGLPLPNANAAAAAAAAAQRQSNENFLLPRAMLKYQSVGQANSNTNSNSMPLTAISNANSSNCSDQLTMISNKTANGHDSQTGFHENEIKPVTAAAAAAAASASATTTVATAASVANVAPPPRNKKRSIASNSSSSTTHTADSGVSGTGVGVGMATATAMATGTATAAARATSMATPIKSTAAGSHTQSHYSTDKSGSSGYYSSNVCSTYSLDEHIYCEPVIDILDAAEKSKSKSVSTSAKLRPPLQLPLQLPLQAATSAALVGNPALSSQRVDMRGHRTHVEGHADAAHEDVDDEAEDDVDVLNADKTDSTLPAQTMEQKQKQKQKPKPKQLRQQKLVPHYSDKLRILETSIENLDRHLKTFPSLYAQEHIVSFVQAAALRPPAMATTPAASAAAAVGMPAPSSLDMGEKLRAYGQLPTIMEGFATQQQQQGQVEGQLERRQSWQQDVADDSLLDIDLDAFLLANEHRSNRSSRRKQSAGMGIDNPSFLTDEQVEENNYKCAKYINSCPEDAYRVESDIVGKQLHEDSEHELEQQPEPFVKRYEDQLHFQNTRELLEDVRDKIRLLSRSRNEQRDDASSSTNGSSSTSSEIPKELDGMIQTLKHELESYLQRMNQHSELEIRQLCSGLGKNQHVLKMQNAFERRRSSFSLGGSLQEANSNAYEAVHDGVLISASGRPLSVREQITTIRCASDPNFKMKRKSITEVFPAAECYIETELTTRTLSRSSTCTRTPTPQLDYAAGSVTQLQRNLTFHRPVLGAVGYEPGKAGTSQGKQEGDSISEWHRKKPSIWQMYYGTNRLHQSLLGKQRNGELVISSSTQPTLSYPSSRPESDFTLDLPRAEQLRLKMEKEKKFRQRCRFITTFLSLVFFLLTVMVVSLVLTRGKRMFGSMI